MLYEGIGGETISGSFWSRRHKEMLFKHSFGHTRSVVRNFELYRQVFYWHPVVKRFHDWICYSSSKLSSSRKICFVVGTGGGLLCIR